MSDASPLTFPCDIPIKVFGRNELEFREATLAVIRAHVGGVAETQVAERESSGGSYLSLTVTVRLESREQADAVFSDLSSHEQILMVL